MSGNRRADDSEPRPVPSREPRPCSPEDRLIQPHGGYRQLKSFQNATIVYDATVAFCNRFVPLRSRTHDQMVQAARSGKQSIVEGSVRAAAGLPRLPAPAQARGMEQGRPKGARGPRVGL